MYKRQVQFPAGGSITIIAVTTLSGGDITHAVPDNTGYITEGQLFLRRDKMCIRDRKGHRSKDKSYSGDNRLIPPKSSYRRSGLAPRCRLVTSLSLIHI